MLTFWVAHFGDHNVAGGVEKTDGETSYRDMLDGLSESFGQVDIPEVIRLLDKRFGEKTYSLRSLFRDEQRRIVRTILVPTVAEAESAYLRIYEHHAALMRFITSLGTPMPREFSGAVEYALNSLLRRACSAEELDGERIRNLLREAQGSNITLDKTTLEFLLRNKLEKLSASFAADPSNIDKLNELQAALKIIKLMPFPVILWSAQNHVYAVHGGLFQRTRKKAQRGDERAQLWADSYLALSELLCIRVQ